MKENQYVSSVTVSTLSKKDTLRRIEEYLNKTQSINCKILKGRRVLISKYLEATIPRKDATARMRTFFVATDIIRKSHVFSHRIHKKLREYELIGFDTQGREVRVHIREEVEKSNKILYFISSFQS